MVRKIVLDTKKRLDTIVYETYKTLDVFKEVLKANRHLKDRLILDSGDVVILPNIKIVKEVKEVSLW
ncbi:MAG TPA: phage tail protein [Archaeoglobaceae archaeon]|nr:phage tail protein [Archaeoglobaceae archaeon]